MAPRKAKGKIAENKKSPLSRHPEVTSHVFTSSPLVELPPELFVPIISKLPLSDALNVRLTCQTLNTAILFLYPYFQMSITGDRLSVDQLTFVSHIHLQRITFKRVAKSIGTFNSVEEGWMCTRKKQYSGPCQFFAVGGIQIRSLSAPVKVIQELSSTSNSAPNPKQKIVYDYAPLRHYLISVGGDDIFNHV